MDRYVIIGNGVAGVTAAQSIARAPARGRPPPLRGGAIPVLPPPPNSRITSPESSPRPTFFYRPPEWYDAQGIRVHLNAPGGRTGPRRPTALRLADGTEVPYDRLLLATGGLAWMPPIEGARCAGIFTLRTLDDARAIRQFAQSVRRGVVIGGGLLGLETARALARPGAGGDRSGVRPPT
jgi:NAD(P)H-nitrite reductase large subunit